ncbi:multidrug efflux SMR transporter [Kytococcus sedentarius]|uniref:Cation/cationic drug transporter n=1 Tax=Kytococcus sedentarius (strain ATCC 14392 / DSM 20547 / JCM 11482 / CCUG 33030 / NBRC 15357 / NCTC 11040 / CCM 314 / 541) TaxID=478801 RepID=C7NIW1_KYTSD|nr:multidrug efflux SMR transporter [Kytococcus sedentarius]ACV05186.1 cation/cationic drug transporter [Kytococcus sedentarius DSM 20547]QQB63653.1 multidrug efflux SMR transporter [Kytococcus sedentarius]STX13407.1 Quaternary ammonium compound-resistance protein sugE [Kytococcus sedentarius]
MSWLYLAIAVVFEVAVGIAAGKANGFKHLWWTIATLASGAIATFFLSLALLTFDVGVGYALWTSLAGVGIVIVGALFLSQKLTWKKFLGILVVIGGVVGLNRLFIDEGVGHVARSGGASVWG